MSSFYFFDKHFYMSSFYLVLHAPKIDNTTWNMVAVCFYITCHVDRDLDPIKKRKRNFKKFKNLVEFCMLTQALIHAVTATNAGTNQSLSFSYNYVYINLSKLFLVKTILESVDIHGLMTLFMLIIDYINYT